MTERLEELGGLGEAERGTALSVLTTEHFVLQTARAGATGEATARTTIFLGSVSAGLVALAFAGQTSRTALYTFGLVIMPVLFLLGFVTYARVLQVSADDLSYAQRINRIRRGYLELSPVLRPHLVAPAPDDELGSVMRVEGFRPGVWQEVLSLVGLLSVLNSVVAGAFAGLAAAAITDGSLWVATAVGAAGLVLTFTGLRLHQRRGWRRPAPFPEPRVP